VIDNLFFLQNHQLDVQIAIDYIDRALGKYEDNFQFLIIRTFNPFYYIGIPYMST